MKRTLVLICDTTSKEPRVIHVTANAEKAKHWMELLQQQGKDVTLVWLDPQEIDIIDSLCD